MYGHLATNPPPWLLRLWQDAECHFALIRRSLLQKIMLFVAHAATVPDLQAVCNKPLHRIRRSARNSVYAPLRCTPIQGGSFGF